MNRVIKKDTESEWIEPAGVLAQQQGAPAELSPPAQRGGFSLIVSNVGANIARQAIALLVVLVLPPLLVRSLDRSTYAVWLLILQIASYITLIDNGIQNVVIRYVALERTIHGSAGVAKVISNAIILLGLTAGVTVLLFAAAGPALTWLLPSRSPALLVSARRARDPNHGFGLSVCLLCSAGGDVCCRSAVRRKCTGSYDRKVRWVRRRGMARVTAQRAGGHGCGDGRGYRVAGHAVCFRSAIPQNG